MAKYFKFFPKTPYFIDDHKGLDFVTNIITRFKFIDEVKNIASAFFTYDNLAGETPESIAYKFYGSVERHWIILLFNEIIDPQFDWYKDYYTFNAYIEEKYSTEGGLSYAMSTVKKYIIREQRSIDFYDGTKIITEDRETDETEYTKFIPETKSTILTNSDNYKVNIVTSKYTQSIFEYETEENEKRRSIKLLRKEFIPRIEDEFKKLAKL